MAHPFSPPTVTELKGNISVRTIYPPSHSFYTCNVMEDEGWGLDSSEKALSLINTFTHAIDGLYCRHVGVENERKFV